MDFSFGTLLVLLEAIPDPYTQASCIAFWLKTGIIDNETVIDLTDHLNLSHDILQEKMFRAGLLVK